MFIISIWAEAVQRNPSAIRATDASLEKDTQKWLRQACDRDGGRQEHYKRNLACRGKGIGKNSRTGPQMTSQQPALAAKQDEEL